jgi:hypothetical protein
MTSFWKRPLNGTSVLGVVCAFLVGVIYLEFTRPDGRPSLTATANTPPPSERLSAADRAFVAPPISEYSEVVDRPLFYPTRRSSPVSPVETKGKSTNLTLIGTVVSGTSRHALVRRNPKARVERVSEGQDIDGWTVESIQSDGVVLSQAGARLNLKATAQATKR